MSISTITVGGNSVSLVAFPFASGAGRAESAEFQATDSVALAISPFTGQTQTQVNPGADLWTGSLSFPPMCQADADLLASFMLELRGMANAFQLGDPMKAVPAGSPLGSPVVNTGAADAAGSTVLHTSGWDASTAGHLLPGDYIQVGWRLHRVLDQVNSDASGNATISVWPSLREAPAAGPIIVNGAQGLWRLSTNKRGWAVDVSKLTHISLQLREYR